MGDVLHALPAVAALRQKNPWCHIGWAIEPAWWPLLEASDGSRPLVDRVHEVPTRAWKRRPFSLQTAREIAGLRRELRAGRYDICVDLQGSIRSAMIGRLSGAKRLVGPEEPRERQARMLYTERVRTESVHVIEQACELLGGAVKMELTPGVAALPTDEDARAHCAEALIKFGVVNGERFVLLAPTAGWGAKMWPTGRFRELAVRLRTAGFRVVVNAASEKDIVARQVAAGGVAEIFACGVGELASVVRAATLVVGGDTGPVQMAGALGTPAVALFGPTDPARTGPQRFPGSRVRVLRDPASVVDHRRHTATEAGLARIGVDEVFEAAMEMIYK
ncbi:glycosyltransferase family 9 protein [Granulicella sp. WH15]|nr:glycosyltransferase family 9 protein [Granulicella sp. WH15]